MFNDITLVGLVVFFVVLLISISLHEMMHAFVAYKLGDDLARAHGRISLNPLQHIDPFLSVGLPVMLVALGFPPILAAKPVPINTSRISGGETGMAAVGLAGPFTNLALAFIGGIALSFLTSATFVYEAFELFVLINVGLFAFNMLPIPPLDGSRLLYAFAPSSVQRLMAQFESLGFMPFILLLLVLLPFLQPILLVINDFILNLVIF
jgi:Zn-dependent protease